MNLSAFQSGSFDVYLVEAEGRLRGRFLGHSLPLKKAREVLNGIQDRDVIGWVVPTEYRASTMTLEDARAIAERELERLNDASPGGRYSEICRVCDEGAMWYFGARDSVLVARRLHPGLARILVDKLAGRVLTKEEADVLIELSEGVQY